jgi:thiaminase/transcriptional activator TenA
LENLMKKINLVACFFSLNLLASVTPPPAITFMTEAENMTEVIFSQIIRHPFLIELANGTLPKQKFDYFSRQDSMYDWKYADRLLELASKAHKPQLKIFLDTAANHSTMAWQTPMPNENDQCPSCEAYSNFEKQAVTESFSGGLAAIAPCYVIYDKVGIWLKEHSVQNNPYQDFINSYSSKRFKHHVAEMKITLNEIAAEEGVIGRQKMLYNYMKSVSYEWQFFNSAYQMAPQEPAPRDK